MGGCCWWLEDSARGCGDVKGVVEAVWLPGDTREGEVGEAAGAGWLGTDVCGDGWYGYGGTGA